MKQRSVSGITSAFLREITDMDPDCDRGHKMVDCGVVMLVDDNEFVLESNQSVLIEDGHSCILAKSLSQARELLKAIEPDVIILDILLPDGSGLDFLKEIRERSDAPVLFLTSKDSPEDQIAGLMAGGNDYITKPYDFLQFRSRVRNFIALKYKIKRAAENVTINELTLNVSLRQAYLSGEDMRLSPKEFALLHLFATNEGKILSTQHLYEKVWGQPMGDDSGAVKTALSRLRLKLDGSNFSIVTQRGAGYSFYKD